MNIFKSITEKIFTNYPDDYRSGSFGSDLPTYKAFYELHDWIKEEITQDREDLLVKFSCGQGNWTQVPHFSILNKNEATDTRDGFYIVALFKHDMTGFYLCFGQGITGPSTHYGKKGGAEYLLEKAAEARPYFYKMEEYGFSFNNKEVDLAATGGVALGYGPGICMHKLITSTQLPDDKQVKIYLNDMINCYDDLLKNDCSSNLRHIFSGKNYWILAPGEKAKYWNQFKEENFISIGWQVGDISRYKTKQEIEEKILENDPSREGKPRNDALCCFDFVNTIKNGDLVFVKEGTKKLLAAGEVQGDYEYQENEHHPHIRKVKWLSLKEMNHEEVFGNRAVTKTLTNITKYTDYVKKIKEFYFGNESSDLSLENKDDISFIIKDTFFSVDVFRAICDELTIKKNIIIQGPPGVGKTFIAAKISKYIAGNENRQLNLVFHENYSYEEFIMGIRPNNDGKFALSTGQFVNFCDKAKRDTDNNYVIMIDEINRANITKVFGEILVNIEENKRGPEHAIKLLYSLDDAFYIPSNIHIIGLMNTADRSLKVVDYALRRRFSFFTFVPEFASPNFKKFLLDKKVSSTVVDKIINNMESINQKISDETLDLGPGYSIGHSFFCPTNSDLSYGIEWYKKVIDNQIIPLLEEYYFDRPEKVEELRAELLS